MHSLLLFKSVTRLHTHVCHLPPPPPPFSLNIWFQLVQRLSVYSVPSLCMRSCLCTRILPLSGRTLFLLTVPFACSPGTTSDFYLTSITLRLWTDIALNRGLLVCFSSLLVYLNCACLYYVSCIFGLDTFK